MAGVDLKVGLLPGLVNKCIFGENQRKNFTMNTSLKHVAK